MALKTHARDTYSVKER